MSPCIMGLTTEDPIYRYSEKSTPSFTKSLSFVLIGPILNKIQQFKNFKICKEKNVWISGQVSGNPYICY